MKTRQTKMNREISQLTSEDNTSDKREVAQDGSNSRSISTVTWGSTSADAFGGKAMATGQKQTSKWHNMYKTSAVTSRRNRDES